MMKLLLMSALVAGSVLHAQQKPISANELIKDELIKDELPKKEQRKSTQTPGAVINVSDTKAVNKKSKSEKSTAPKRATATSFKDTVEN